MAVWKKTFIIVVQCEENIQVLGPGWLYGRRHVYSINCTEEEYIQDLGWPYGRKRVYIINNGKSIKMKTFKILVQGGCMEYIYIIRILLM